MRIPKDKEAALKELADAEDVSVNKLIIRAIEKNRRFYGIPFGFHFIRFWQTVLPTKVFDFFFGKVVGLYNAMDEFKGRA